MLRIRVLTLLAATLLVTSACGGSTSGDASETTAAATTMADDHADTTAAHDDDDHTDTTAAHGDGDHTDTTAAHDDTDTTAAHDDDHGDEVVGMSEEYIPEAVGEVEASFVVHLSDFAFDGEGLTLAPGSTIELTLVNEGMLIHEFRLTTAHRAAEHVASGHADHGDEGEGHHEDRDVIVNVGPGETRTVVMTLPDHGDPFDQIACLIPGHYEAGMFLDI